MSYKLKALRDLSRIVFDSVLPNPTFADISITDDEVRLDADGIAKFITINFNGLVYIYNKLPDGYGISITRNRIFIYNLMGKQLKEDGLLFNFQGNFNIVNTEVRTFSGNKFMCGITDNNKTTLINNSKTNLEDDTLLLLEEVEIEDMPFILSANKIDDNSIKGLHTKTEFANGYSGFYNYHPNENVYMSGKELSNNSQPILNPKLPIKGKVIQNKIKKLSNKYNVVLKEKELSEVKVVKEVEKVIPEVKELKPVSTPIKEELKKVKLDVKKGGKY